MVQLPVTASAVYCAVKLKACVDADDVPPRYRPWNAVVGLVGASVPYFT